MAQELVFKIELETGESEKAVVGLTKEIDQLTEAIKKNKRSTDEEILTNERNTARLKELRAERDAHRKAQEANRAASQANQKQIESEIKGYDSSNKSLNENRRALAEQKKAYGDLKNPSKEATASLKALNEKVKEQEAAFGDNQRNVGNYSDFLKGNFKGTLNATKNGLKAVNDTLLANPVGLVIQLFTAFKDLLSKNDAIAEKFEQTMAAINATIDVLVGRFIKLSQALVALDFGAVMDSFAGVGDEINKSATAAVAYTKGLQELEDQETDLIKTNEKLGQQIDKLVVASKNKTLSDKEAIALIKEANKLDTERTNNSVALAEKRLALLNKEAKRLEAAGQLSDAFKREQAEAEAEVTRLKGESATLQERLDGRMDALKERFAERDAKRAEAEQKRIEAINKAKEEIATREAAAIETLTRLREQDTLKQTKNLEDRQALEIEIERRKMQTILDDKKKLDSEKALAEEQYRIAVRDINQRYDDEVAAKAVAQSEYDEALRLAKDERLVAELDSQVQKEAEKAMRIGEINEELLTRIDEVTQAKIAIEDQRRANELNNIGLTALQKEKIETDSINKKIEINKKGAEEIQRLLNKETQMRQLAATNAIGVAQNVLNTTSTLAKEGSEGQRAIQSANALIATYLSATQAYAAVVGTPYVGPVLAPIAAGAAVVAGLANVAQINNVKFADGGLTEGGIFNGPSHANGGIKFAVGGRINEAEGGEAIINKNSTAMFKDVLSYINVAGGGKKFADGGIVQNSISQSVMRSAQPNMIDVLRSIPAPVVSVIDIERVTSERATVIDQSKF